MLRKIEFISTTVSSNEGQVFTCLNCNLNFSSNSDLAKHREFSAIPPDSYTDDKSLTCEVCEREFTTHRAMRQHYGKIHSRTKRVKCTRCHKKFKDNYAVKFHMKQVHDKITQVECYLCQKVLYNSFSFKKHILVCSQRFFNDEALESILDN